MSDEAIRLRMEVLGVDEETARFIDAIERGEIDGDIVMEDEGREVSEAEIGDALPKPTLIIEAVHSGLEKADDEPTPEGAVN